MSLNRRRAAAMLAVAAAAVGTTAPTAANASVQGKTGPSPEISQVVCGSRTDWFRIWTGGLSQFEYCYANAGYTTVNYYSPHKIDTGNNAGIIWWHDTYNNTYHARSLPNHYSVFKFNAGTQYENRLSAIQIR